MAESKSGRRNGSGSRSTGLSAVQAAVRVREQFPALVGRPVESVLGIEREDDGWRVTVAVVELSRIPSSTDVLGAYTVDLDGDGELTSYRRRRRYTRSQPDED